MSTTLGGNQLPAFYELRSIKRVYVYCRGLKLNATYRMDFVCFCSIIVECKAVKRIVPEHRAQLFNHMRLTKMRAGVLVNFLPRYIEIERYFYNPETEEMLTFDGKTFVFEE